MIKYGQMKHINLISIIFSSSFLVNNYINLAIKKDSKFEIISPIKNKL